MDNEEVVSEHYAHGNLLDAIQAGLAKLGQTADSVTVADLAPIDDFHIGGRVATKHLLDQLNFGEQDHLLDVGCGLGGVARFVASTYKSRVTGIDLTPEYVETGRTLSTWVGLAEQITHHQGSATAMQFDDATFDGGYMMHVGMNIEEKHTLFREIFRVLKPGATFGVYDVMRNQEGELAYPVPWAAESATSYLATPEEYKQALSEAGFEVTTENNRREFALDSFEKMRANAADADGPPPLGLHTLMQESTAAKVKNMVANLAAGLIAPVEIIAHK